MSLKPSMAAVVLAGVLLLMMRNVRLGAWQQVSLMLVFLAVLLATDVYWFQVESTGLLWTASMHLHWAGEAACLALLAYFLLWVRPGMKA